MNIIAKNSNFNEEYKQYFVYYYTQTNKIEMLVNIELPLSKYYYMMIKSSIFSNYFFNNPNIKFTFEYIKSFKTKNIFELHSRLKVAAEQNLPGFLNWLIKCDPSEYDYARFSIFFLFDDDSYFFADNFDDIVENSDNEDNEDIQKYELFIIKNYKKDAKKIRKNLNMVQNMDENKIISSISNYVSDDIIEELYTINFNDCLSDMNRINLAREKLKDKNVFYIERKKGCEYITCIYPNGNTKNLYLYSIATHNLIFNYFTHYNKLLYSTKISESDINDDDSKMILLSKDIQFDHPLEMYYNFNLIDETFSIKGLEGKKFLSLDKYKDSILLQLKNPEISLEHMYNSVGRKVEFIDNIFLFHLLDHISDIQNPIYYEIYNGLSNIEVKLYLLELLLFEIITISNLKGERYNIC